MFVAMQVLDRCSVVTFAAYLPHKGEVWLFIEAPQGLPTSEESGIYTYSCTATPLNVIFTCLHMLTAMHLDVRIKH